ncbi:hypothetical protein TNCV_3758261 [Trichonephila clavipes]|nr:hypothetical protein TNCV_3758261 [Trichonephila clavipes]
MSNLVSNIGSRQWFSQQPKCKCFRTYSSVDTVRYEAAQQMSHMWASVEQVSLPTMPREDLETLRLDHK